MLNLADPYCPNCHWKQRKFLWFKLKPIENIGKGKYKFRKLLTNIIHMYCVDCKKVASQLCIEEWNRKINIRKVNYQLEELYEQREKQYQND